MRYNEQEKLLIVTPREMTALAPYIAEHTGDFYGWKIVVDFEYGVIQGIQNVLSSEEIRLLREKFKK